MPDRFDTAALRQLADMPLPQERAEADMIWRHVGEDLAAAADYIEELERKIALTEAVRATEVRRSA